MFSMYYIVQTGELSPSLFNKMFLDRICFVNVNIKQIFDLVGIRLGSTETMNEI